MDRDGGGLRFFLDIRFYHLKSSPPPHSFFVRIWNFSWRTFVDIVETSPHTERLPFYYNLGSNTYRKTPFKTTLLLPPANEVCGGYVFTPVCQSFCSQGGGGIPARITCGIPACLAGPQAHTQEGSWGVWPGGGLQARPPPSRWLTLRSVCILLEYILVYKYLNSLRKTFEGKTFLCFFYSQKSTISWLLGTTTRSWVCNKLLHKLRMKITNGLNYTNVTKWQIDIVSNCSITPISLETITMVFSQLLKAASHAIGISVFHQLPYPVRVSYLFWVFCGNVLHLKRSIRR